MNTKPDYGQKYQIKGIGKILINNFFDKLKKITPTTNIDKILEVGAGEGYSSQKIRELLPTNTSLTVTEYDAELLEKIAEKIGNTKIAQANVYNLPFAENEFDLIYCLEVLEHLETPNIAIKELHRVSKRYVVLSVPHEPWWRIMNMARGKYWSDWGNTPGHIQHWNTQKLELLGKPYFVLEKISYPIPWIMMLLKKK